MALNPEFVGRTYPASAPYQVGREKVREFATSIGDSNPAYHDVEVARSLGYADVRITNDLAGRERVVEGRWA